VYPRRVQVVETHRGPAETEQDPGFLYPVFRDSAGSERTLVGLAGQIVLANKLVRFSDIGTRLRLESQVS
jgi:hypothetical protein